MQVITTATVRIPHIRQFGTLFMAADSLSRLENDQHVAQGASRLSVAAGDLTSYANVPPGNPTELAEEVADVVLRAVQFGQQFGLTESALRDALTRAVTVHAENAINAKTSQALADAGMPTIMTGRVGGAPGFTMDHGRDTCNACAPGIGG